MNEGTVITPKEITNNNNNNNNNNNSTLTTGRASPVRINSHAQFKSEDFIALSQQNALDTFTIIEAMTRNPKSGLNDYLVNELYKDDQNVEFWIPQLANMVLADSERISLARYLLDKCASLQFALKLSFWLQSAIEDSTHNLTVANDFASECEMAAINCKSRSTITFSKKVLTYNQQKAQNDQALNGKSHSGRSRSLTDTPDFTPNIITKDESKKIFTNRLEMLKQKARVVPDSLSQPNPLSIIALKSRTEIKQVLQKEDVTNPLSISQGSLPKKGKYNSKILIRKKANEEENKNQLNENNNKEENKNQLNENNKEENEKEEENIEEENIEEEENNDKKIKIKNHKEEKKNQLNENKKEENEKEEESDEEEEVDLFEMTKSIIDMGQFKQARSHVFQIEMEFIHSLTRVSALLKEQYLNKVKAEKNKALVTCLNRVQEQLVSKNTSDLSQNPTTVVNQRKGVFLPLMKSSEIFLRALRILPEESFILSSKDKVPFMMFIECLEIQKPSPSHIRSRKKRQIHDPETALGSEHGLLKALFESITIARSRAVSAKKLPSSPSEGNLNNNDNKNGKDNLTDTDWIMVEEENLLASVYPELWAEKVTRIQKTSPWAKHQNWTLKAMIVKAGDDLRQEQMAMQVISTFHSIFQEAELPLWLYPYAIVASGADSGFIEVVKDAISLDILKQRLPANTTLSDYFKQAYGPQHGLKYIQAVRNFVESLAGYSLVCYFLQIKDRHNGNILIDKEGHIIHIDYGFILTSSPGSIAWESAPFKLTQEYIDLLGGENSDMFAYFRLLLLRGFLELRIHSAEILLLIELLIPGNKMGAFLRGPETTLKEFADRFHPELTDEEVVPFITQLIKESANSSRTTQYDLYQYYRNGILV